MNTKKLYKVTSLLFERSEDKKFIIRKYITIKDNLCWMDAKKMRGENKSSFIVPQSPSHVLLENQSLGE